MLFPWNQCRSEVSILLTNLQQAVKEDNFNWSINPSPHVRYEEATLGAHKLPHRGLVGQTNCRYLQGGPKCHRTAMQERTLQHCGKWLMRHIY